MTVVRACQVWRTKTNGGLATQQRGFVGDSLRLRHRFGDSVGIMAIDITHDVPAVGFEARRSIIGKPAFDFTIDGDTVVISECSLFAETQGAGK